ncbi:FAD-dependent oxidoreductase [Roseovarius sp. SYSU LYC5161]|uniref:oxidoreductase n=1 Tax=Roseovarius halophilus (ex Wu et al. 2025) TaxID=3376060 RepID=UPI00399B11CB
MSNASRYGILFDPLKIGPVTAPNRFYQVPHCNGMGHVHPRAEAANRGMKAAGGWGTVCTQETEIHPTSDLSPSAEQRIWDDRDIPALRLMTDAVHEHGALAGIELAHNGHHAQNLTSRAPALGPMDMALHLGYPKQARGMDKSDIAALRRWHRAAARRARQAGFDIVYVYAGHHMTLPHQFLLPHYNDRADEYGGSLGNRLRLTRELLEDTLEELHGECAVAFRFAVDEMAGPDGMQAAEEGRAVVEMLAEMPDLWDVNVAGWENDSLTTRFEPNDGYQIPYIDFVKQVTSKPVVGTGRLTSPDMMVGLIRKGTLDLIGAARPSISDPFLPAKIREGRIEDIRECIGCNVCVSADNLCVPIRCTQNPTQGEEWRRGWHPEVITPRATEEAALVIGAGPAGLECAMQLARRGYHVTLAEAGEAPGGRVARESALPGLGAWGRVADHRLHDLHRRPNVDMFLQSPLDAAQVAELGIPNVFLATGSTWRRDGRGRTAPRGMPIADGARVLTPDDIMAGDVPGGSTLVFDDDQGYLAAVLAEKLAAAGGTVSYATPAPIVSAFTDHTLEQSRVHARLAGSGVAITTAHALTAVGAGTARLACMHTGTARDLACDQVLLVTERAPETALHADLVASATGFRHLEIIGDAAMPGLIADAVWSGHMAARNFERPAEAIEADWFRREMVDLGG